MTIKPIIAFNHSGIVITVVVVVVTVDIMTYFPNFDLLFYNLI